MCSSVGGPSSAEEHFFRKTDVEVKKNEVHVKGKKARHKGQHFLITAKSLPLFRTNKASTFCH